MGISTGPSSRSAIYVVKPGDGGWVVVSPQERQLNGAYPTRDRAVEAARARVQVGGGEVRLMGRNGRVLEKFTLGRAAATTLNSLEGVVRTPDAAVRDLAFDSGGLSPGQRRRAIIEAYRAKR